MKKSVIFLLLLLFLCGTLLATEADRRHVRALSEQGLFAAVEEFCNDKFQQPDLSETDKILLAAELAQSYSQQLILLEPAQRSRILRRLETLETNWLESNWLLSPTDAAYPDRMLANIALRLQCAMAYRSLGDEQRFEADAASESHKHAAYRLARSTLQDALERLKKCRQELQALKQRVGINATPSLNQRMLAWEYAITMQQGITQQSLALTLSAEEERNFVLRQAAETFSELASKESTEPVIVQCKIAKAACHRLCGELDRCAEILQQLRSGGVLTPECQLKLDAEWIRYNMTIGNIAEMRRDYAADRDARLSPDFHLARLELFLVNDPPNIRPETHTASRLEQSIHQQSGPYWARRARMIVLTSGNMELDSAEISAARAERYYQDQRFAEAAELYEQAAAKADINRQTEKIHRYHRHAAHAWGEALKQLSPGEPAVEYQSRLIALLRTLAVQNPHHSDAQELHSSAIRLQSPIIVSQPELLDDYLTLIEEHAKHWNDSPQLPQYRRLAIILLEQQQRTNEAAAMLPLLDLEQIATLPSEIQRLRARQLDTEGKAQEAVNMLTALLKQQREPATLHLFAEILTRQSDESSLKHALNFWTELEQKVPKNSETWWSTREGILVVLCKQNRHEEALQSFTILRQLYPDLGGAERKERLLKQFEVLW
jgi:hypothetical protein